MALFDFLNLKLFHKDRATESLEKLLREEFIYQLKDKNSLTIFSSDGEPVLTRAVTLDKKHGSLIVAEQSPDGILILERNDPVFVESQANKEHEVYSFHSRVSNIILDEGDILYEIQIPARIEKGQRRKGFRVSIDSPSMVTIRDSVYQGQVSNLSTNGILFTVEGYWPQPVDENPLVPCHIDMGFLQLDCHVDVRYIHFEPYPARCTFIGGEIKHLNPRQQHQLDNYLHAQQRISQRQKAELKYSMI